MPFLLRFLLLCFLSLPNLARANDDDTQAWSIFRYNHSLGSWRFGGQLQLRYTFGDNKLYEEQLNPSLHYESKYGEFGFIFTLGTNDGFESRREYRYAFEYELIAMKTRHFELMIRFRQELRDFAGLNDYAHRFRILNEITSRQVNLSGYKPFLSSEFNIYLNDFDERDRTPEGLSSHRTIFGFSKKFNNYDFNISYVHDYAVRFGEDEVRHILSGTFVF
jgi:hypothetical protein